MFGSCTIHLVDSSNLPAAAASSPVQATSLDDRLSGLTSSTPVRIRSEEERSLSAKLQQLFESADSVTAQESLLVCLRCVPIASICLMTYSLTHRWQLLDKIANKIGFSKVSWLPLITNTTVALRCC